MNMIRHSWAKRAIKSKVSLADCSISMGYSIEVFQDKYLNSVKIKIILIYKKLIKVDERGNRCL